jgi:tRNA uridine 5-carboxymethylaminomethyl modification enzyme
VKLSSIITRPFVDLELLSKSDAHLHEHLSGADDTIVEGTQILMKYEGYIAKEQEMADKINRLEHINLPADLEYDRLTSMSIEARQKLKATQPRSIAQAARVSGVSPADIAVLLVYIGR